MLNGSKLLMLGLKGSGKSSFLAALWHVMEAAEISPALMVEDLQPDRKYLNWLRDNWLSLRDLPRTSMQVTETVSMTLKERTSGKKVEITLPDQSGESFRLQWDSRTTSRSYAEFAATTSGLLLFIHPGTVKKTPIARPFARTSSAVDVACSEWSPEHSSTQVQLVDLLQIVLGLRTATGPLPVAVIISAWDTVGKSLPPESWLEDRMPLLSQFLTSNPDELPSRIYGVSALGGDLERDRGMLADKKVPSQRVQVVAGMAKAHNDLTAPITFLLGTPEIGDQVSGTHD